MVIDAERLGGPSTSDDDPRITRVGKVIRKYKLDELPQLINVLRGDMSLVGPRPEVQQYVDQYTPEEEALLKIRPGITDWASIWNSDEGAVLAGCDDPDRAYEELIRPTKLKLQLAYANDRSQSVDLEIMLCTVRKLWSREFVPAKVRGITAELGSPDLPGEAPDSKPGHGYETVTELPGHGATAEQLAMIHTRYRFAAELSREKDVLELACGPGIALGYLGKTARSVVGGDVDAEMVRAAARQYGSHVEVREIDAQRIPFDNESFDVILLLEAIYYLSDPLRFISEARRVLRPGGSIFICSANRERIDFNPSPFTHRYFSAAELRRRLLDEGFHVNLYGAFAVTPHGLGSRLLGGLRTVAAKLRLIPETMAWKIRVKRMLFGRLEPIPAELEVDEGQCEELVPISGAAPVPDYKVIYAVGGAPPDIGRDRPTTQGETP